jgi:predicted DCC family thiol-disulfide oxidoreductase YuxK
MKGDLRMQKIILFDGVCNFCDSSVQFILNRDKKEVFSFAALANDTGKELLSRYGLPENIESMVLIDCGKIYLKSSAALRIASRLKGAWKLAAVLLIVPRPFRDFFYDQIAKRRYQWFGEKTSCPIPPPEVRKRFLS